MKLDKNKVYVKNGNATKAIPVEELIVNGKPLAEVLGETVALKRAYEQLITELKGCYVVKKDSSYIVEVDNELKRIDKLVLFEEQKTKFPLRFYKVENGKIVLDKRKVGAL